MHAELCGSNDLVSFVKSLTESLKGETCTGKFKPSWALPKYITSTDKKGSKFMYYKLCLVTLVLLVVACSPKHC